MYDDNMLSIDVYSLPHKALRAALADAGTALGAVEADDLVTAVARAGLALDELTAHAEHEDTFIQPIVERFLPELAVAVEEQHLALAARVLMVRAELDAALAQRSAPVAAYRAFQRLVSENLSHLDHEETVVLPALWSVVPGTDLADVMQRFRSAHPEAVELYRRNAAALTFAERELVGAS
jgi:hypothetical protein